MRLLRRLAKAAHTTGHRDGTVYGTSRAATRSFFAHHVAAIASAVVFADALVLENEAASLDFQSTLGPAPPTRRCATTPRWCA